MSATTATVDAEEVRRFGRIAAEWWDPDGKFRPLHQLGPARLGFIRSAATAHFGRDDRSLRPLDGLSVLDIGCGGGLVSEPLARLGGRVLGVDPSPETVAAARQHAAGSGLSVTYEAATVEALVGRGETFDLVVCLEVVEHVPDVGVFLGLAGRLVRPGGLAVLSTINRTVKAYLLAIVGAEYVLRWLPVGTHRWERFVTPDELARHAQGAGLVPAPPQGVVYDLLGDRWHIGNDTDVNYMVSARRPARGG